MISQKVTKAGVGWGQTRGERGWKRKGQREGRNVYFSEEGS